MTTFKSHIDYDLRDGALTYGEQPDWENGSPFAVHRGLVVRFRLPDGREYDEQETLDWFRAEYLGRVETLRDGGEDTWDGSNHVWRYESDERAQAAADLELAITEEIAESAMHGDCPGREIWDAADWYLDALSYEDVADELGITAESTDEDLGRAAELARNDACDGAGRPIELRNLDTFLARVREVLQPDEED